MINKNKIPSSILALLETKLQGIDREIDFPPPVFEALKGEVVSFDAEKEVLINKFPVLKEHLNPYGNMQGGIIAAAIDNTIGPLSMLVSPPNFTRYLNLKYGQVVSPELGSVLVTATYTGKKKRQLFFEAVVHDHDGNVLASAKAIHWIID